LVELHSFSIMPDVYVARKELPPDVLKALQQALVSLQTERDKKLLAQLRRSLVEGFDPANAISERNVQEIRAALTNELRYFESGTPLVQPQQPGTNRIQAAQAQP
jgi:ABC-type phosphate/phosphonate transport system substrate-binding protein